MRQRELEALVRLSNAGLLIERQSAGFQMQCAGIRRRPRRIIRRRAFRLQVYKHFALGVNFAGRVVVIELLAVDLVVDVRGGAFESAIT